MSAHNASSERSSWSTGLLALLQEVARACNQDGVCLDDALKIVKGEYVAADKANGSSLSLGLEGDAGQVLSLWHDHPHFVDERGLPKVLDEEDQFPGLCSVAGISSSPANVLRVLLEAGAVEKTLEGVSAKSRRVIMATGAAEAHARVARLTQAYFRTLWTNAEARSATERKFERTVSTSRFDARQVPALMAYLTMHGQAFLEDLDSWMTSRESSAGGRSVGVGLFLFTDEGEVSEKT